MPVSLKSDIIHLSTSSGASAQIALKGATVISYNPTSSSSDVLFLSSKSNPSLSDKAAVRGGIPVCWPIFGPPNMEDERFNKMKQHGFARTSEWTLVEEKSGDEGETTKAILHLSSSPATTSLYAPSFSLTYTVLLSSTSLSCHLTVVPTSSTPVAFQALLHAYFRLPSSVTPPTVLVEPLTGLEFADKVQGGSIGKEDRAKVQVEGPKGEVDRVYFGAQDRLSIAFGEGKGGVLLQKDGLEDVVLWNPGPEKGATIGDMEEGGADRYICLEPGQVKNVVELKEGQSWTGGIVITPKV